MVREEKKYLMQIGSDYWKATPIGLLMANHIRCIAVRQLVDISSKTKLTANGKKDLDDLGFSNFRVGNASPHERIFQASRFRSAIEHRPH